MRASAVSGSSTVVPSQTCTGQSRIHASGTISGTFSGRFVSRSQSRLRVASIIRQRSARHGRTIG